MIARLRSWWEQIKQRRVTIGVVGIVLVVIALIIAGYWFDWTGFNTYSVTVTTNATKTTLPTNITITLPYKTLYDWLQLVGILAIPVVVAWFTVRHNHDIDIARAQHENDQQITLDNQRETVLQTYLDKMSELLLHENLRKSERGDDVRIIAEARTLAALSKLDPNRKRIIIIFLYQSDLVVGDDRIIGLDYADLRGVDLSGLQIDGIHLVGAYLQGANLSGADLSRASLESANLDYANLSGTNLKDASLYGIDLTGANLVGANLSDASLGEADLSGANLKDVIGITNEELEMILVSLQGATMPDGTKHA